MNFSILRTQPLLAELACHLAKFKRRPVHGTTGSYAESIRDKWKSFGR
jgi:hypothetical protein